MDSQVANVIGIGNTIIQIMGDNNVVTVVKSYLDLISPAARKPSTQSEINLLYAYSRSVELVGRDADMASLWTWLHSDRHISIRTVTGRAGAGKTRIAVELIERLIEDQSDKWAAGFVRGEQLRKFVEEENSATWVWNQPTLVVIDYAASLMEPLRKWLRNLAEHPAQAKPLRILLLEREADTNTGWLNYLTIGGGSEARVPELFDPIEPQSLIPLNKMEDTRRLLSQMLSKVAAFKHRQPPELPSPGTDPRFDTQLQTITWSDPLYLMMAAVLAVSTHTDVVTILDLPRTDLVLQMAGHEIKRLTEGIPSSSAEPVIHLAAYASLCSGLSAKEALAVAKEECIAFGWEYPGGPGALVKAVKAVLPAPKGGIAPIVPDILAEALLLESFRICALSSEQQSVVIVHAVEMQKAKPIIPFVVRTIQDFYSDERPQLLEWIESLIAKGKVEDFSILMELEDAIPEATLALREMAVAVIEVLSGLIYKIAGDAPSEEMTAGLAFFQNNLAMRLSYVGRWEAALTKAEEAVKIFADLAKSRPDAFLPDYARALNTLAIILTHLGHRNEAVVKADLAVQIREELANSGPNEFLPELAISLDTLANALSNVGLREEALLKTDATVRIFEQLATFHPRDSQPDLAWSLHNQSMRLSKIGRREEALSKGEAAVRIYEQLAVSRPDTFQPDLANSLNTLSNALSDAGQPEEALLKAKRAVLIYDQLTTSRPDAFLPSLAMALNTLSNMWSKLGCHEEALIMGKECVQIYEKLAKVNPGAYLPYFATSMNDLAAKLSNTGRREEALLVAKEAVQIFAELALAHPSAFLQQLAMSLDGLAIQLSNMEQREEAMQKGEEAVEILRQLSLSEPDAFQPELARVLSNLASWQRNVSPSAALASAEEAVQIRERLSTSYPDAYLPDLAMSLNNLANALWDVGRHAEALEMLEKSVRIYTKLATGHPNAFLSKLAVPVNNLARMFGDLGRLDEALRMAEESVRIYEQLSANKPDVFLTELATAHGSRGRILGRLNCMTDASLAMEKAIVTLLPFFQTEPEAWAGLMAQLFKEYLEIIMALRGEPDWAMLARVRQIFENLNPTQLVE